MFTVALVGADGAGKSTVCRRLLQELPFPACSLYMGVNFSQARYVLPTTWLLLRARTWLRGSPHQGGPRDPAWENERHSDGFMQRGLTSIKQALRLTNLFAEEWFRQARIAVHHLKGRVVLCDRHFFIDYYATDIDPQTRASRWHRRVHGAMLRRHYPRPDLVLFLDAPAEVLWARKQEGSLELLKARADEYRRIEHEVSAFAVLDATRSLDEVTAEAVGIITAHRAKCLQPPNLPPNPVATLHKEPERV